MTDKHTNYMTSLVPNCLLTYQYIEQCLKECLYRQHAIVKRRISSEMHYKAPIKSISNAAMGRLIQQFETYTEDDSLISLLKQVKDERDHLAHQGLLLMFDPEPADEFIDTKIKKVEGDLKNATECLMLMFEEYNRLDKLVNEVY
jgi:hypothetical protein